MKIKTISIVLTLVLTLSLAACGIFGRGSDLKGTSWTLIEINGQPVQDGTTPSLVFEADQASGNSSCNSFSGEYEARNGKLTFGPLASTLMFCEDVVDQEAAFLIALQEADAYQIKNGDLQILDADGQVTLTLAPQN